MNIKIHSGSRHVILSEAKDLKMAGSSCHRHYPSCRRVRPPDSPPRRSGADLREKKNGPFTTRIGRGDRSSRGQQIVDDEDTIAGPKTVVVNLDGIRSILE